MTAAELHALQTSVDAGVDPYFKLSRDTESVYGPNCIVRDLLQDRTGAYWLATWQGIIKYDGKVFINYTLKKGLIQFHVASCYEDKKGNLWFGTVRGGLYRYNGQSFTLFKMKDGLAANTVSCFAEDRQGNLWFGTDKGASRYDGKTFTNYTVEDGLPSNRVSALMLDKTGKLWFGCQASAYMADDGGIVYYDGKSFNNFPCKDQKPIKTVSSLFEDKNGNIWVGGMDGLGYYNGTLITHLASHLSYYITGDKGGKIWLTIAEPPGDFHPQTPNQILYCYDGKKLIKVLEKHEPGDCQIFGKIVNEAGEVWFGTMKGIGKYDGKSFTYFTR